MGRTRQHALRSSSLPINARKKNSGHFNLSCLCLRHKAVDGTLYHPLVLCARGRMSLPSLFFFFFRPQFYTRALFGKITHYALCVLQLLGWAAGKWRESVFETGLLGEFSFRPYFDSLGFSGFSLVCGKFMGYPRSKEFIRKRQFLKCHEFY